MTTPGLQFLVAVVAGWVNRNQREVVEYLQAENRVLRERLGGRRLRFTDAQRCRLAVAAKRVGRKGLFAIETVVARDTLLRWYRNLVAPKYEGSRRRGIGRPRTVNRRRPFHTARPRKDRREVGPSHSTARL